MSKDHTTPQRWNQEQEALCNLTEGEKKAAIDYFVESERRKFFNNRIFKGEHLQDIEIKWDSFKSTLIENTESILADALKRKVRIIEIENDRKKREDEEVERWRELYRQCDANYFYNLIRRHFINKHGEFKIVESQQQLIKTICFFFGNDARFESELGFSFKKGLMIAGDAGLGKTEIIKAILQNPIYSIQIYPIGKICDKVKEVGKYLLDPNKMLMIDDVGTEQNPIKHYGTDIFWFKEFIESYYNDNEIFTRLIITTNLDGDGVEQLYGNRVRDRLREMMNPIFLEGESLRK